jgi:hypothetical protein
MANKKKYITLGGEGCDFRKMAKIMTDAGFKMNHATARNQLIMAVDSLLMKISSTLNANITSDEIEKLRNNQEIHNNLADVLFLAYQSLEDELVDEEFDHAE